MKIAFATAALSFALLCSSCGATPTEDYNSGPEIGSYREVSIPWPPHLPIGKLHCARLDTGGWDSSDSGLSCDWIRWHRETDS